MNPEPVSNAFIQLNCHAFDDSDLETSPFPFGVQLAVVRLHVGHKALDILDKLPDINGYYGDGRVSVREKGASGFGFELPIEISIADIWGALTTIFGGVVANAVYDRLKTYMSPKEQELASTIHQQYAAYVNTPEQFKIEEIKERDGYKYLRVSCGEEIVEIEIIGSEGKMKRSAVPRNG